jgi:adenylate cyclase class 2
MRQLGTPWQFETNVLYDMPDRKMRARTEILRIRDYGAGGRDSHKRIPDSGVDEDGCGPNALSKEEQPASPRPCIAAEATTAQAHCPGRRGELWILD